MSRKRFGRILAMLLTLTMLLSMLPAMAAGTQAADSVYRNGKIYTVDEEFSIATALAIQGDRLCKRAQFSQKTRFLCQRCDGCNKMHK